ncbi:hypothetical protein I204_08538 [Kwoniella mangroviensis CBS 8886]|nr:hypothetical protein I204_08538 [Kwoniella mangroviensis CBS 8886]
MTTYPLAQYTWDDPEVLTISSLEGQLIGTFPLDFLRRGGVNNWGYVLDIVCQLLCDGEGGTILGRNDDPVNPSVAPYAGDFHFKPHNGQSHVTYSRGPEYSRKNLPSNPDGSHSTYSNSKRSSVNQCLKADPTYPAPIFSVSAGLLLRDDIHHAFDRLELSFYFKDGDYYLHFFVLRLQMARELHGKRLASNRFRGKDRDRPDPRYLKWHYNQCIKARIRGFAAGMELPATSSEAINEETKNG